MLTAYQAAVETTLAAVRDRIAEPAPMTAAAQTVEAPSWLTAFYAKVDALDTEGVLDGVLPGRDDAVRLRRGRCPAARRSGPG